MNQINLSPFLIIMIASAAWAETNTPPPLTECNTNSATRIPEVLVVDTPIIEGNTVN